MPDTHRTPVVGHVVGLGVVFANRRRYFHLQLDLERKQSSKLPYAGCIPSGSYPAKKSQNTQPDRLGLFTLPGLNENYAKQPARLLHYPCIRQNPPFLTVKSPNGLALSIPASAKQRLPEAGNVREVADAG